MSEETDFKVAYLGQDLDYWEKIKDRFRRTYQKKYHFYDLLPKNTDTAEEIYIHITELYPQVIYIDLMFDYKFCVKLLKFISRNNITKLISTVALYNQTQYKDQVSTIMMAGTRLHQIKCLEINDVVYNPISFYDINQAVNPKYSTAEVSVETDMVQDLRIAYYNENHLTVETNSPMKVGDILRLEPSFMSTILESDKVIVEEIRDSNLYYNLRYSVDLRLLCIPIDEFEGELVEQIINKKNGDEFDYEEFIKVRSKKLHRHFYLPILNELKKLVVSNIDHYLSPRLLKSW